MRDFKKLHVWRKAHALAINCHGTATRIRGAHNAALRTQIIRAAQSVAANIAEGCGQRNDRQFARYLGYAINSASELEYHLILARDFGLISDRDARSLLDQVVEVRKMLHGLMNKVTAA